MMMNSRAFAKYEPALKREGEECLCMYFSLFLYFLEVLTICCFGIPSSSAALKSVIVYLCSRAAGKEIPARSLSPLPQVNKSGYSF
jgi:hypothetical protein